MAALEKSQLVYNNEVHKSIYYYTTLLNNIEN